MNIDFEVIVPKITSGHKEYPFKVTQVEVMPGSSSVRFIKAVRQYIQSLSKKPDIIWSQSCWSGDHLHDLNIPMIVSHGDSGEPITLKSYKNVFHRFMSHNQRKRWSEKQKWLLHESVAIWQGFPDHEFDLETEKVPKTVLFVGGLGKHKGLSEFEKLASQNPDYTFYVYGVGNFTPKTKNVKFMGELKRGAAHAEAFKKAEYFFMFVQWEEAFGRVIIEAMSKGTPVLGSNHGSLPELIGPEVGVSVSSIEEINDILGKKFDNQYIFEFAKREFNNIKEVTTLFDLSRKILFTTRQIVNATNILWSRNWHNLVTCSDIPDSYYNAGSEYRHSAEKMITYFSMCGGPLWVRLNSNTTNNDITTFATYVLPKMTKPFILITSDGDNSVPSHVNNAENILNSPLCKAWYTQNYDGSQKHPKLKPIPIGFNLHTHFPGLWSNKVSENLEKMLKLRREALHQTNRFMAPYLPWWRSFAMSKGSLKIIKDRNDAKLAIKCMYYERGIRMSIDMLWKTYGSKMFALSPPGNGLDVHRTWELLFFGVIPVVKSVGGLDDMYKDLPVIVVKNWTDMCAPNFFVEQRERLKDKWPMSLDKFKLDYWVDVNTIPKGNFILIAFGENYAKKIPQTIEKWAPKFQGYQIHTFDLSEARKSMIKWGEADALRAFDKLNHNVMKADLFRLVSIYNMGGYYIDGDKDFQPGKDVRCLEKLSSKSWFPISPSGNIEQWNLFSTKGSELYKFVITQMVAEILSGRQPIGTTFAQKVFDTTSTVAIRRILKKYPGELNLQPTEKDCVRYVGGSWGRPGSYHTMPNDTPVYVIEKPRWFDAIHVNMETDVLLMRFAEYEEFVDEFHVFESNVSQQGRSKPLYFKEHMLTRLRDAGYNLHYHLIPNKNCQKANSWACENYDREYVGKTMQSLLKSTDIMIFSDADEIIDAQTLKDIKEDRLGLPIKINPPMYKYSFHWQQMEKQHPPLGPSIGTGKFFAGIKNFGGEVRYPKNTSIYKHILEDRGWHISSFGTLQQIDTKSRSNVEGSSRVHPVTELQRRVYNGISLWDKNTRFVYKSRAPVPMPRLATVNPQAFRNLMLYNKKIGGGIPTTIIQTMRPPIPPWVKKAWVELNPGFEYVFFNDEDASQFIETNYSPAHIELFDKLKEYKHKADFFRYCYLYKNGGIYADIDLQPLVPLKEFIHSETQFFSVISSGGLPSSNHVIRHIMQAYLAVVPNSPFMKKAIDKMLQIGTSFESQGPPWSTHPTNQLYEILNDAIELENIHEGTFNTEVGVIQLSIEHCPSYYECYIEYNKTKIANTRYKKWRSGEFV